MNQPFFALFVIKLKTSITMAPPKTTAPLLIKGYLPVRLKLSSSDETFFYVKEHQESSQDSSSCTLFVANAPVLPTIQTHVLLKALFGRYGDVKRVTIMDHPRNQHDERSIDLWTEKFTEPSFLPPRSSDGSFAHIVFTSKKEMKRTVKAITEIMSSDTELPGLELETIERQTLAEEQQSLTGILAVAQRYRNSRISRPELMDECNAVMQAYQDEEEQAKQQQETSKKPDEDGFVRVSYSAAAVGSKTDLDQAARRRKTSQRTRKKKAVTGASELKDFYRFQTKVESKRKLQELRERFEDDLMRVKKLKEERQFKPF
jgi:ribosomal RNA-processing protein 7